MFGFFARNITESFLRMEEKYHHEQAGSLRITEPPKATPFLYDPKALNFPLDKDLNSLVFLESFKNQRNRLLSSTWSHTNLLLYILANVGELSQLLKNQQDGRAENAAIASLSAAGFSSEDERQAAEDASWESEKVDKATEKKMQAITKRYKLKPRKRT